VEAFEFAFALTKLTLTTLVVVMTALAKSNIL
jgi:hypothetical protein